jgi:hypothetical protein
MILRTMINDFVKLCLLAGILVGEPAAASTNDMPVIVLKTGLWEDVLTESHNPARMVTKQACIGSKEQEARFVYASFEAQKLACPISNVIQTPTKITYIHRCDEPGLKRSVTVTIAGDFSNQFEQISTVKFDVAPVKDMTGKRVYRFLGACPNGMKPGDETITFEDGTRSKYSDRYTPRRSESASPAKK